MTATLTDHSRRAHGGLTESSLTTHDRKGREGKGSGIGREFACGDLSSHRPVGDARTFRVDVMPRDDR